VQSTTTEALARERELNSMSVLTVIVALSTVTMTFGAMIAVFFIRAQKSLFWGHIQIPGILWVTTALLLTSSVTFELARHRLLRNDRPAFFRLTAWTTALAVLFLIGQLVAWFQILHSGVILANNPHSWFIFLFSGLHGAHIALGLAGLIYLLARTHAPASGPKYQMNTRALVNGFAIFWHYIDFVWLVLFVLLLNWRR
jgi:cytochrome c oxidase subunit 3